MTSSPGEIYKPAAASQEWRAGLVRAPWNEALLDEVCSFLNAQYAFADALIEMALGSTFTTMENV